MKRNILLFIVLLFLIVILIYPIGYLLNELFFHQKGGGFDVGFDDDMVNIFIGGMATPPLISFLIYSLWGKNKSKWLFASILSLPSVFLFTWAEYYLLLPFVSILVGITLAKLAKLLISKFRHHNLPMVINK